MPSDKSRSIVTLLAAVLAAVAVSGCGVHGTTGIWNELHQTNAKLERIIVELKGHR